jgi:hypothetical protein
MHKHAITRYSTGTLYRPASYAAPWPLQLAYTQSVFHHMYTSACPHRALVLITVVHCLRMAEDCNPAA